MRAGYIMNKDALAAGGGTAGTAAGSRSSTLLAFFCKNAQQVPAVVVPGQRLCQFLELRAVDEALPECDFFGAADLYALTLLDGFDEKRCLQERVVGPGIEPSEPAPENIN